MTIIENKYTFEKQKDKLDESRLVGDRWQEKNDSGFVGNFFLLFLACKVIFCIKRFESGNRIK